MRQYRFPVCIIVNHQIDASRRLHASLHRNIERPSFALGLFYLFLFFPLVQLFFILIIAARAAFSPGLFPLMLYVSMVTLLRICLGRPPRVYHAGETRPLLVD